MIPRTHSIGFLASLGFTIAVMLFLSACDEGLAPPEGPGTVPGFGGTIHFSSNWPPADSVLDLRVVAFRVYPPENILLELIQGRAVFSDALEYGVERQEYVIEGTALSGVYEYVAVAQQYGPRLEQDWRVIGVYTTTGDVTRPSAIDLQAGRFIPDVNVDVDFDKLPPQPF